MPPLPSVYGVTPAAGPAIFQLGVPAQDVFPAKTWSRLLVHAARQAGVQPVGYPDPCGEAGLRREIAAYLAVARGISCAAAQVFITAGYAGGLGLVLHALGRAGAQCWMEDPGYPLARRALALAGIRPIPVAVDEAGLDVSAAMTAAPDALFALVTPGQQAPLGHTLCLERRHALLDWAAQRKGWIIEDDYLGELQLSGRAAPALASLDQAGRVLHIGTFSKTITPALRLGFLVVPSGLVRHLEEFAGTFAPAPAPALQDAVAAFLRGGHYLRHLRHMKRVYAQRRQSLAACLAAAGAEHALAGLAVLQPLPPGSDDLAIVRSAQKIGLSPVALSPWYADPNTAHPGLLLGVTNLPEKRSEACYGQLSDIIRGITAEPGGR